MLTTTSWGPTTPTTTGAFTTKTAGGGVGAERSRSGLRQEAGHRRPRTGRQWTGALQHVHAPRCDRSPRAARWNCWLAAPLSEASNGTPRRASISMATMAANTSSARITPTGSSCHYAADATHRRRRWVSRSLAAMARRPTLSSAAMSRFCPRLQRTAAATFRGALWAARPTTATSRKGPWANGTASTRAQREPCRWGSSIPTLSGTPGRASALRRIHYRHASHRRLAQGNRQHVVHFVPVLPAPVVAMMPKPMMDAVAYLATRKR